MKLVLLSVSALLFSIVILLTGHGLQLTVAPLRASELGWSTSMIGFTGSAYFLGFVLGCLTVPRLVSWVGHIRVYAVLTAAATSALLLLGLFDTVAPWLIARLITGWSIAGIYMIIESWLNERTTPRNRGMVLSIYTTLTLLAICLGQLAIGANFSLLEFIIIGAILLSVSAIPIGLSRSSTPSPIVDVGFQYRRVYDAAHIAIGGAAVGGLVTSGFWVLGPLVATANSLSPDQVGIFMAVTLLGGASLQLPVGRLSDRYDRRLVLAGLAIVGALVCITAATIPIKSPYLLYGLMFLFGGTTFPLYSISLAHANDNTSLPLIETGSVVLLVNSAGAIIGPVATARIMDYTPAGMFIFASVMLSLFAIWALVRISTHKISRHRFEPFKDLPKTTHEVMEITTDEYPIEGDPD